MLRLDSRWFNNISTGVWKHPDGLWTEYPCDLLQPCTLTTSLIKTSNNIEYGTRNGACPSTGTHPICADPLFVNEPAQKRIAAQSALDVFNLTLGAGSFYPASNSPMIDAGTSGGPSTDYFRCPDLSADDWGRRAREETSGLSNRSGLEDFLRPGLSLPKGAVSFLPRGQRTPLPLSTITSEPTGYSVRVWWIFLTCWNRQSTF